MLVLRVASPLAQMATKTVEGPVNTQRQSTPETDVREVRRCPGCGEIMFLKPLIQCGDCGAQLPLRCLSYKSGRWHYAECLDLNLLSRGRSAEEAVSRLQEQMFTYVATAFEGDLSGLIPRRAPFASWLRYYGRMLRENIWCMFHRHPRHLQGDFHDTGAKILSHC